VARGSNVAGGSPQAVVSTRLPKRPDTGSGANSLSQEAENEGGSRTLEN
jgi:hypothetical protein